MKSASRGKTKTFSIGDKVAYSVAWLRSTGSITGDIPFLRGTVRTTEDFGSGQLVTIAWELRGKPYPMPSQYHDDGLGRVLANNLTLQSRIGIDSALNT